MYLLKLKHPDMVEGLVLINMSAQAEGFMDWAAQKVQKLVSYRWICILMRLEMIGFLN